VDRLPNRCPEIAIIDIAATPGAAFEPIFIDPYNDFMRVNKSIRVVLRRWSAANQDNLLPLKGLP